MNKHYKPGYIMILTLMIISVSIMIVTYLTTKGMVYSALVRTMTEREKARQLAASGIQLAFSTLSTSADEKEEKKEEKKESPPPQSPDQKKEPEAPASPADDAKKILTTLLPQLNKFQPIHSRRKLMALMARLY